MADTEFTSLGAITAIAPTDQILVVRAGVPYRFTGTLPTIDSSGRVGIGAASPQRPLHAYDGTAAVGRAQVIAEGAAGGYGAGFEAGSLLTGGSYKAMGRIVWDGEAAWNTTASTQDSFGRVFIVLDGADVEAMRFTSGGVAPLSTTTASGANMYQSASGAALLRSTSSKRYKRDIEALEPDYADAILNLRPIWYRSKSSADNPHFSYWGFVAEEAAEIDPRLVIWAYQEDQYETVEVQPAQPAREALFDKDGVEVSAAQDARPARLERRPREGEEMRPDGFHYDRLTVLLLDLVKRQEGRIAALEARMSP